MRKNKTGQKRVREGQERVQKCQEGYRTENKENTTDCTYDKDGTPTGRKQERERGGGVCDNVP